MFLHETVERCSRCAEVTPHSRRAFALPKIFAGLAAAAAVASFLQGDPGWTSLGIGTLAAGAIVLARDRERCWSIACERCRGKERRTLADSKPTLDGRTEINL